jgi:hypothetical protein
MKLQILSLILTFLHHFKTTHGSECQFRRRLYNQMDVAESDPVKLTLGAMSRFEMMKKS